MHRTLSKKPLQLIAMMLIFAAAGWLHAQVSSGAISGTAEDPAGAAIAGAAVTITNQGTGVSKTLTTDGNGFYSAEGLSVGQYTIDISKPGFEESNTRDIQIDPGQRRSNNVILKVGNATSKVTVTANEQQVNTQTSESGGTITSKQMTNLMLNGRNFQTLAIADSGSQQHFRRRLTERRWI